MKKKSYCTMNDGNCEMCALSNYNRDCRNQPLDRDDNREGKDKQKDKPEDNGVSAHP